MRTKEKVRFGSANVFADLEFENPEEELIRATSLPRSMRSCRTSKERKRPLDSGLALASPRFRI